MKKYACQFYFWNYFFIKYKFNIHMTHTWVMWIVYDAFQWTKKIIFSKRFSNKKNVWIFFFRPKYSTKLYIYAIKFCTIQFDPLLIETGNFMHNLLSIVQWFWTTPYIFLPQLLLRRAFFGKRFNSNLPALLM